MVSGEENPIPGSMTGKSCGRLGGMGYLDLEEQYLQTYSRKAGCGGNTFDEHGILFFNASYSLINTVILDSGSQINSLRAAKYG